VFSATIPEQLNLFAQVGLKDYVYAKLDAENTLPETMSLNFIFANKDHKMSTLIYLLKKLPGKTIVFASTRFIAITNKSNLDILSS
jgi:ATP-dependent RNA helicase DDX54/DBP10